jgi:hypothetical protein
MEVLRVPPYPIVTIWNVPEANTDYVIYIEDLVDHSSETIPITSNSNSQIEYDLPREKVQFDRKFLFKVLDSEESIVIDENLDVYRPYVIPETLSETKVASEIAEYKMLEIVARSIIDEVVVHGFYNHKTVVQTTGNGSDYIPLWYDTNKILKAYENNVLVYDSESDINFYDFKISLDNSSIYKSINADAINKLEGRANLPPITRGDLVFDGRNFGDFPQNWDYTFVLDTGYKTIPPEIEYATKLLIDDIKCGRLEYYKRYVTSYNTDQYKIQFDKQLFGGTGNLIVDKLLAKYTETITRLGVL